MWLIPSLENDFPPIRISALLINYINLVSPGSLKLAYRWEASVRKIRQLYLSSPIIQLRSFHLHILHHTSSHSWIKKMLLFLSITNKFCKNFKFLQVPFKSDIMRDKKGETSIVCRV